MKINDFLLPDLSSHVFYRSRK